MIIKKIVTITLISSIALMVLLLVIGLAVPSSVLDKFSRKKVSTETVIAVNTNGEPIAGATVTIAANGAATVVDANGKQIANATAAATPAASTAVSPTATTPTTATPKPTSTPAPTISSFSASPASIAYNVASTLAWASANASSCSLSPGGTVATSGSKSTGALTSTTTYTLSCSGNGSASKTVTVTVAAAPVAPSCGSPGGVCSSAQVATHNSAGNCWVIYGGSYYIITNYVNKHNGGSGAFTSSTCGHDNTAYMDGTTNAGTSVSKHRHSNSAYNTLNSYKVGAVN